MERQIKTLEIWLHWCHCFKKPGYIITYCCSSVICLHLLSFEENTSCFLAPNIENKQTKTQWEIWYTIGDLNNYHMSRCVTQHVKKVLRLETKWNAALLIDVGCTEVRSCNPCGQYPTKLLTLLCLMGLLLQIMPDTLTHATVTRWEKGKGNVFFSHLLSKLQHLAFKKCEC